MAHTIRVKHGGSIMSHDSLHIYRGGTTVPPGHLTSKQMEEHVRSGFADYVNIDTPSLPDKLTPTPPGVSPVTLKADEGGPSEKREKVTIETMPALRTTAPGGLTTEVTSKGEPADAPLSNQSPWTVDPASLNGMDLAQLNVMILERDHSITAFETVPEAIAFLTQDFRKA